MKWGDHEGSPPSWVNICGKRNELFRRPLARSRPSGPPASSFQYQSANTKMLVIQSAQAERSMAVGGSRCAGIPWIRKTSETITATVIGNHYGDQQHEDDCQQQPTWTNGKRFRQGPVDSGGS